MSSLAERILAFMTAPPPTARIFRRHELDHLGPRTDIDQTLHALAQQHRIGSPARDIWFPLTPATEQGHPIYLPPAPLKALGQALLAREGVATRPAAQERQYHLFHATQGREGTWGVPTFQDIGVDRPVALSLAWRHGYVHTEYQGGPVMDTEREAGYTATSITEPTELARVAERKHVSPVRLEKDIRVNAALQGLGQSRPWPRGGFLFLGGTSLTKAWRLSPRFSEDIDLRFQPGEAEADLRTYADNRVTEPAFRELYDRIQNHVLPLIPGAWMDDAQSYHRQDWAVQLVFVRFSSHFQAAPGTLKFELQFLPGRVPWTYRPILSHPHLLRDTEATLLAHLPTVPLWVTMKGKLEAIAARQGDWKIPHMRHLVDLGVWLEQDLSPQIPAFMAQTYLTEKSIRILVENLTDNLRLLGAHARYAALFHEYMRIMYPGGDEVPRPLWQPTLRRIQRLWLDICRADMDQHPLVIPEWPGADAPDVGSPTRREIQALEARWQDPEPGRRSGRYGSY